MNNVLKIEAFSGASGDMFLSALAGLADAYEELTALPKLLNFNDEADIKITDVKKNGILCKQVKVIELETEPGHRHLSNIIKIIDDSQLTENAKTISKTIFDIIGNAESKVHGIPLEKIHFHEVGAVDSIIDICGTAYFLDKLKIGKSYLTSITTGKGFVNTAHGLLPVPCPATKLILENIPYVLGEEDGERLTPTGAAIIKYLEPELSEIRSTDIKTAYGPGEKEFISPNVLRLSLCEVEENNNEVFVIETNIDDGNPEYLGTKFQNQLLELGALDFYFSQVIMKKGRPGLLLTIICKGDGFDGITDFVLNFTSTIGLRYYKTSRIELDRNKEKVSTELGDFSVKITKTKKGKIKIKPESEEILEYSIKNGISPTELSQKIISEYKKKS